MIRSATMMRVLGVRWCLPVVLGMLLVAPSAVGAQADAEGETATEVIPEPPVEALEGGRAQLRPVPEFATEAERAHLDLWLQYSADVDRRQRRTGGVSSLLAGSLLMGVGIGLYVSSSSSLTDTDKGFALALIGSSSLFLGIGIFNVARAVTAEKRLERWRALGEGPVSLRELGQFEGELRAQSEVARRMQRIQRWSNFALFLGGGLILGLTPASKLDDKVIGYAVGGAVAGVGLLGFAFSFIDPPQVDYWNAYRTGQPLPSPRKWRAAPAAGRTFVGARVSATF